MFPNNTLKINESYNCPLCNEFLTGYQLILHLVDSHEADLKNCGEDYEVFNKVKSRFVSSLPLEIYNKMSYRLLNAVVLCHILGQKTLGEDIIKKIVKETKSL